MSLLTWASCHPCLFVDPGHCSWAGWLLVLVGIQAVFVCGQLSSFFDWLWWQGSCGLSLALGIILWLLLAALLGCGCGWLKKEVMSQVVTLVWCLKSHVRLHVQSHMIFLQFTVKTPQSWSSPQQRWDPALRAGLSPTCQLLPLKATQAWQSSAGITGGQ